jgi:YaiO family outer membrane protein
MGDLYRTFDNGFEGSVGFRSLVFGDVNNFFLSFYVAKYHKNWWIFYRNFVLPSSNDNRTYLTHTLQARYYYNDKDRFTAVTLFTGNLPLFAAVLNENFAARTTGINIEHQIKFNLFWLARFGLMLESEEYQVQRFRSRNTLVGMLIKRF